MSIFTYFVHEFAIKFDCLSLYWGQGSVNCAVQSLCVSQGNAAALPPVLHALQQPGVSAVTASTGLQRLAYQCAKKNPTPNPPILLFWVFFPSLRTFPWIWKVSLFFFSKEGQKYTEPVCVSTGSAGRSCDPSVQWIDDVGFSLVSLLLFD